jgi:hypothetical protein
MHSLTVHRQRIRPAGCLHCLPTANPDHRSPAAHRFASDEAWLAIIRQRPSRLMSVSVN